MSEPTITVCADCSRACCWQGELMCDAARDADVRKATLEELRELDLEHPRYWAEDLLAAARETQRILQRATGIGAPAAPPQDRHKLDQAARAELSACVRSLVLRGFTNAAIADAFIEGQGSDIMLEAMLAFLAARSDTLRASLDELAKRAGRE